MFRNQRKLRGEVQLILRDTSVSVCDAKFLLLAPVACNTGLDLLLLFCFLVGRNPYQEHSRANRFSYRRKGEMGNLCSAKFCSIHYHPAVAESANVCTRV